MEQFKLLWSKTMMAAKLMLMAVFFTISISACEGTGDEGSDTTLSMGIRTTGITIYFEKPSSWNSAWIWYDEGSDNVWETTQLSSSPGDMTYYRTEGGKDWYKKELSSASTVTFLFNKGDWGSKVNDNGSDYVTTQDIWVRDNGSKSFTDPISGGSTTNDLVVYFKKPSGWGAPNVYGWKNGSTQLSGGWPGSSMSDASSTEGADWYKYTFSGESSASLIFNSGSNQTVDLSRSTKGWFVVTGSSNGKSTGQWYDQNPDQGSAPSISISPAGQSFSTSSFNVDIQISSTNTIVERKYTMAINGGSPVVTTMGSNNQTIDLGNHLTSAGDSLTLSVYAKDSNGNDKTSSTETYSKVSAPTGLTFYFKKPSGWSQPKIYAWTGSGSSVTKLTGDWSGSNMQSAPEEGTDWYKYTITGASSCSLIFNDGSNQTADLVRGSTGWYKGSTWYNSNPDSGGGDTFTKLGVDYKSTGSTFAIWSPDSSNVKVVVDDVEYDCAPVTISGYSNVYGASLVGDFHLKEYQFKINGVAVRDPYGVMVKYEDGASDVMTENGATVTSNYGSNTNIVVDLSQTEPVGGWSSVAGTSYNEREDAIIYEVHVRDFTIDQNSGVSSSKKGKFSGMVETGTTVPGTSTTTGLDHLKELGITHVQILPFYDSGKRYNHSTQSDYNWGYDPVNYNVPEDRYATNSSDYVGRIKEVKTMVNEFHKNGIRVIMDVVYNHTFRDEMFENITNDYYGGLNLSGCGNSIDTSNPMVSRFIRDSLEYWIEEYNIDGFRFDLIGILDYQEVKAWGEYLNNKYPDKKLLIFGEPWNGAGGGDSDDPRVNSKVRLGKVPAMASGHIGVFNDQYRNALKSGDSNGGGTSGGYIFNQGDGQKIERGMKGSITSYYTTNPLGSLWTDQFTADPEQTINYVAAHDNLCLWDKILKAGQTNSNYSNTQYQLNINKFATAAILTSQGIPFIHGGDEILRTKYNNGEVSWDIAHNSYMWGDAPNRIRWSWKTQSNNKAIFNYYKSVIQLRKDHPGFRLNTWNEVNNWITTYRYNNGQVVVGTINAGNNGDNWSQIKVVFNSGANWTMPDSGWTKVLGGGSGNVCEGTAVTVFKK